MKSLLKIEYKYTYCRLQKKVFSISNEGMKEFVMLTLDMIAIPLRYSKQIKIINLATEQESMLPKNFEATTF